jgi:aspartyl-tRNA(Asn)/glutamyl-tRNA(Gln) amidotransferase subunit A
VVPWALGSDTGGSIRIPSSMCGTFGLKPATGRLSLDGMMPLAPSMDCPGPIASTAGDLAVLYGVMSGGRAMVEVPSPDDGSTRLQVGMPGGFFANLVHPETLEAVARAAGVLEGTGVSVEEVDGRGIEDSRRVWFDLCAYEFVRAHPILDGRRELVDPSVLAWVEHGERLSEEDHDRAVRRRAEISAWYRARLERFAALLVPTTPYPAPRADQLEVDLGPAGTLDVARVGPGWLTSSVNLSGLPAVSIPAGRSNEGLPIGVSLIGRDDGEDALLGLAALWERAAGYTPVRPPLPSVTIP